MATPENPRYRMDVFHAHSLEGNPLQAHTDRKIKVYLPPEYFTSEKRFPVIYFLHGYGGNVDAPIICTKQEVKSGYPLLFRLILWKFFKKFPTFEKLDDLISSGRISPFILVQPGGNLPLTHLHGIKGLDGNPSSKGSLYVNSPWTGNYADYIFEDVIDYIDSHYRTYGDKLHRAVVGGSMGGYGTLYGAMMYPDKFQAAYALSPAISWLELLEISFVIPLYSTLYGKRKAAILGQKEIDDILDTADLIFAKENPLLPTIQRDTQGNILSMDEQIKDLWTQWDLKLLAKTHVDALKSIHLGISCEEQDEYQFASQIRSFQKILEELNIPCQFDFNDDGYAAKSSPHSVGIAQQVFSSLAFCAQFFPEDLS